MKYFSSFFPNTYFKLALQAPQDAPQKQALLFLIKEY